jgi:CheY-like chemotaxis protein/DNA-binding FrmR family transcriptional regulator
MDRDESREPVQPRRGEDDKRALLFRLARIEGQVRGLRQMIEKDRYTGEVIQQATAILAALREVAILCFQDQATGGIARVAAETGRDGTTAGALIHELTDLLKVSLKHYPGGAEAAASRDGAPASQTTVGDLLKQEPTSILLVEDDPVAAEILKTGLDSLGCSVTVASTGEDALDMLQREDCSVDWLLADVVLPGRVDGWAVGDEFRLHNPYGRAVFISAYEQKDLSRKPQGSAFLYKPVRPAQLIEVFRGLEAA